MYQIGPFAGSLVLHGCQRNQGPAPLKTPMRRKGRYLRMVSLQSTALSIRCHARLGLGGERRPMGSQHHVPCLLLSSSPSIAHFMVQFGPNLESFNRSVAVVSISVCFGRGSLFCLLENQEKSNRQARCIVRSHSTLTASKTLLLIQSCGGC